MQHKVKFGSDKLSFSRIDHAPISHERFAWLKSILSESGNDLLTKYRGAQSRCSGVELFLQTVDDLTNASGITSTQSFLESLRRRILDASHLAPIVKGVDWDNYESQVRESKMSVDEAAHLARKSLLSAFHAHAEFIGLFAPHLHRIPRNADGKLIANKDSGCAPPDFALDGASSDGLSKAEREAALSHLDTQGIVTIGHIIPLSDIEKVRNDLRIKSSYSVNQKPFDTRQTDPVEIFAGDRAEDVDFKLLASGRCWYQLRCSLLEAVVKPVHASVMPVVWEYLSRQRNDSFLNRLMGQDSKTGETPRVFLSEVALVCSDPLSGQDSWHATNGSSGVVVMVPLSPYQENNGNMVYLPGTHKAWGGLAGIVRAADTVLRGSGVNECNATCGDAVVMDARLMRMTLKNELFNRSKVWLAFHYDFTDKPAPGQWLTRTLFMNALSVMMVHMDNLYRKLPPISPPNKLE
jgi:hypothetical protein